MIVYVFTSPTCAPCKDVKEVWELLQEEYQCEWKTCELGSKEAVHFNVTKVPTMVVVGDTTVKQHSGTNYHGYWSLLRYAT